MHRLQDDLVPLYEPFETVLRGFNRQQVLAHLESLDGRISMISADRDSALTQVAELSRALDHLREESELLAHLRQEVEKANEQVERIQQLPIVGASVRIQRIVALAEEEAAELKARTEQEAATLKARVDQEITARRRRATSEAEALLRDTTQRCKQLEGDSERRRRAAEQETERRIARRESEANAQIQSRNQRSITGLHVMLKIIGRQLAERVSAAERKEAQLADLRVQISQLMSTLEAFRAKVTAQLGTTRQVLAQALEQVQPTKVDHPGRPQSVPIQRDGRAPAEQATESATVQLRTIRAE
ncbi:MAG: hypothetical protein ABR608_06585 [Pseudonocardiaceae bacterium]